LNDVESPSSCLNVVLLVNLNITVFEHSLKHDTLIITGLL
jgi:hypothetical protein